ncbi:MAG TPA: CAP domain-containing protein [Solirubrobacteraceae bacterium]|nr:CAP domain-containing protein [Solirubrobacteraceae bacterium]
MLRSTAIAGAIALFVCCLTASGAAAAADGGCAQATVTPAPTTLKQASRAVLCLVNSERASHGLAPLRGSPRLRRSARRHSRDMVVRHYFSHVSLDGADLRGRVMRVGYLRRRPDAKIGETLAWGAEGYGTPAELVRAFMQSAEHRPTLLDPGYHDVGVGLVLGAPVDGLAGGATLTLVLGGR